MGVQPIHITVAEDNPSDVATLREVLDQVGLDYTLTVAMDGEEARDFILKSGRYRDFPPADLIFLDMNMPKLKGLEVLREVPDSARNFPSVSLRVPNASGNRSSNILGARK